MNLPSSPQEAHEKAIKGIENGQARGLLDELEAVLENPKNLAAIKQAMLDLDASNLMNRVRGWWNKRPKMAQWSLMNLTHTPLALTGFDLFETLVKGGFVDYKGHLDKNPEEMEAKVQAMGGKVQYLLRQGIAIGGKFIPEVAAVKPFVGPLSKLYGMIGQTLDKIRPEIVAARRAREAAEQAKANLTQMAAVTHQKVEAQLPLPFPTPQPKSPDGSFPLVSPNKHPSAAANDTKPAQKVA